jgi:hypothetical protein
MSPCLSHSQSKYVEIHQRSERYVAYARTPCSLAADVSQSAGGILDPQPSLVVVILPPRLHKATHALTLAAAALGFSSTL